MCNGGSLRGTRRALVMALCLVWGSGNTSWISDSPGPWRICRFREVVGVWPQCKGSHWLQTQLQSRAVSYGVIEAHITVSLFSIEWIIRNNWDQVKMSSRALVKAWGYQRRGVTWEILTMGEPRYGFFQSLWAQGPSCGWVPPTGKG